MLISSFTKQNGTLITPQLLFYLQVGLVCTQTNVFEGYTLKKRFNGLVQSAVDARIQGDENPNSSIIADTMKLRANTCCGYYITNRSQHAVTIYPSDKNTQATLNCKFFRKFNLVINALYEVEPKHKLNLKIKDCRFFVLQYTKPLKLELYYNFFTNFCDVNMFEELEKDTNSLYLALAENEKEDCIRPETKAEWE